MHVIEVERRLRNHDKNRPIKLIKKNLPRHDKPSEFLTFRLEEIPLIIDKHAVIKRVVYALL